MKKTLLIIILLIPFAFFAQQWAWAKDLGKADNVATSKIKTNAAGEVFTAVTNSFQPTSLVFKKETAAGALLWSKTIGGSNTFLLDLSIDKFNNSYLMGFFANNLILPDTSFTNNGNYQVFIVAYDNNGNRKWVKVLTNVSNIGNYITNDYNGDLIYAGATAAGSSTLNVLKYSPAGAQVWQKTIPSTSQIRTLTHDKQNNIFLTGTFAGSLTINGVTYYPNQNNPYYTKSFIAKLNPVGDVKKVQIIEGADVRDLGIDSTSANFYVIGTFEDSVQIGQMKLNSGCPTATNSGCTADFVARLDTNNVCYWAKRTREVFRKLDVSKAGDTYLTGNFSDTLKIDAVALLETQNRTSVYIAKISKAGVAQWAQKDSGANLSNNFAEEISWSASGSAYISGTFHNFSNVSWFGSNQLPVTGTVVHFFSARYSEPTIITGISNNNNPKGMVNIYPNPTTGRFTVSEKVSAIYDLLGNNIYTQSNSSSTEIDLSDKARGIYFVEIKNDHAKTVKKIILE